jgi:hypothetical protein
MNAKIDFIPSALCQVREWKADVWKDLKKLPFTEAASVVADRAHAEAIKFGFQAVVSPSQARYVAEPYAEYGSKVKDAKK